MGTVTEPAVRVRDFSVKIDGEMQPILSAPMKAQKMDQNADDPEKSEYLVRINWQKTLPVEQAIWKKGMFANQNSACKLRNKFTLEKLVEAFGLED